MDKGQQEEVAGDSAFEPNHPVGPDIAFFLLDLDGGGAERAIISLSGEIANQGYRLDIVVGDASGDYLREVSDAVRLRDFASRSRILVLLRLISYLRRSRPKVVMAALDLANILLVVAASVAGYRGRIVLSQRAVVPASLADLGRWRRVVASFLLGVSFRRADAAISNSVAAADDIRRLFGVAPERIVTIPNAVHISRIESMAGESFDEPDEPDPDVPLIVAVGSLSPRKDIPTLIRAFAIVRRTRLARLVVVGKGEERDRIERLIRELELTASVELKHFAANPYPWIAAASVFVSTSTAEGFPNVIAEALALGRRIVATDCPGDTAALLEGGKWGRLVPVGNPERTANAILAALDDQDTPDGRIRAADFAPGRIAREYLDILIPERVNTAEDTGSSS